jgi:segregation and condensation protein B
VSAPSDGGSGERGAAIGGASLAGVLARMKASVAEPCDAAAGEPRDRAMRIAEALLFAAAGPLDEAAIAVALPASAPPVGAVLAALESEYSRRGVTLQRVAGGYMFRTAPDLAHLLRRDAAEPKKLSRAALETLAIIAYHQPVTRAEIEALRGVAAARGTIDLLIELGWIRIRGRRRTPGRPVTFGTTEAFLVHFGLDHVSDLPGADELAAAGLIEGSPGGRDVPAPSDAPALHPDEDPLGEDVTTLMEDERRAAAEGPLDADEAV